MSPMFRPEMMVGAASPLWGYFAGAVMLGSAWWWMTRWLQPTNLEALEAALEPATEALADAVGGPVAVALVADKDPPLPVGGESAPVSAAVLEAARISEPGLFPDLAPAAEPVPAPQPAAIAQPAAPEPAITEPAAAPAVIPEPTLAADLAPAPEPVPAPEPAVIPPKPTLAAEPEKPQPKPEAKLEAKVQPTPAPKRKARDSEAKPH
jgi:hypothetical protein